MSRLAYIMHVPWSWARQRPHQAAEGLASSFDVDVFLPADPPQSRPAAPVPDRLKLHAFARWPDLIREGAAGRLDAYDALWFCSPLWFSLLAPTLRPQQRVIYDCMDEFLAFPTVVAEPLYFTRFLLDEISLVERADLIFCSSQTLADRLRDRYRPAAPLRLVHNAAEIDDDPGDTAPRDTELKRIVYVGTISHWMDFKLLLDGLDAFPGTRVDLYGPSEMQVPVHPRLQHHGPQPHPRLHGLLRAAELLVMPFVVDELVAGVNPVKLYEYIHSGVPAAAVRYGESEAFAPYVYLYAGRDEYFALLRALVEGRLKPKASPAETRAFLATNTWPYRQEVWTREVADLLGRTPTPPREQSHLAHLRRQILRAAQSAEALGMQLANRDARIAQLEREANRGQ